MGLSNAALQKLKKDTEEKKKGINRGASSFSSKLSGDTTDQIAMDIALKKLGFTHNREDGKLNDPKYSDYRDAASRVDDGYIDSFLSDWNSYSGKLKNAYDGMNWKTATSWDLDKSMKTMGDDLMFRSAVLRAYADENRDGMDDESYSRFVSSLEDIQKTKGAFDTAFSDAKKFYSQWETEEDYNDYVARQAEYEALRNFDVAGAEREIAAMKAELAAERQKLEKDPASRYLTGSPLQSTSPYGAAQQEDAPGVSHRMGSPQQSTSAYEARETGDTSETGAIYARISELEKQISQKNQYMTQAKRLQEGERLAAVGQSDSEFYDPEFGALSQAVGDVEDVQYRYINDAAFRAEYDAQYRNNQQQILTGSFDGLRGSGDLGAYDNLQDKGLGMLNENEKGIYNYYYAKEGKEAAERYLDSIQETLNYRRATGIYETMEDETLLELAFGVAAGLDQFRSGMESLIWNGEGDYVAPSAKQMASGMIREDLADVGGKLPQWLGGASLGQMGYDTITTTANMAPSIITSMGMNVLLPGSGAIVGGTMMGASAAGNAYQEMLNLGYDKKQARGYSLLVGGSEAGLQYLLGGIGKLGGKLSGKAIIKILNGVDNAFLRVGGKILGNMASEGLEEGLQEILTPWFQNLALYTDEDVNWDEVAYSTLLGMVTAGFMEGGSTVKEGVNDYRTGVQLNQKGVTGTRLAELGQTFAADTVAYQLAGRVNDNTGAYTMGRLFNEIGATLTEQNISEITEALVQENMPRAVARKNAEAMAAVVEGEALTERQIRVLEGNDVLAKAFRETVIDPNSTANQRTKGYNDMLLELAREKASQESTATQTEPETEPGETVEDAAETAAEGGPAAARVKMKSVSQIRDGQVKLSMEDGSEVNLEDAGLDADDAMRIETLADIEGITPEDANFILGVLKMNPGANARFDALGAKEAYRYGYFGYSQDHIAKHGVFANALTESQCSAIYDAGKAARKNRNAAPKGKASGTAGSGVFFESKEGTVEFRDYGKQLTEKQKAGVQAAMVLKKLGIGGDIYFFESYRNPEGKLVYSDRSGKVRNAPNGWYSEADGSIHIDLNAGNKGNGFVLFTLAHELTHFIEQWSPEKYKVLADFLVENYEKGQSMDKLVRAKQAKLSELRRKSVSYQEAYSEVIADSMEAMLADGNVLEKLTELKARDKSLVEKVKQFFDNLAAKIRSIYEGLTPDSEEGNAVLAMKDALERIQELFAEALVEASDNYQGAEKNTTNEGGVETQVETKYSDREDSSFHQPSYQEWGVQSALYDALDHADRGRDNLIRVGIMPRFISERIGIKGDFYIYRNHSYENMVSAEQAKKDGRFSAKAHYHNLGIETMTDAVMALESPIMTIATKTREGNPAVIMILPVEGKNKAPLYAVLSFYSNKDINGDYSRKPHVVLTIAERNVTEEGGRAGQVDIINNAVNDGRVISFDEKMRDYLTVKTKATSLGIISDRSLTDNLAQFQKEIKAFKEEKNISYSDRDGGSVSNRALLAGALEDLARNDMERNRLREYREEIEKVEAEEQKLRELNAQIKELSFAPGPRDTARIRQLRDEATKTANRINVRDKKLLRLEATAPLMAVLERERKKAAQRAKAKGDAALEDYRRRAEQKQKQTVERYQEARKKAAEGRNRTAMRHKIQKVVKELNQYLLHGTKDRHVPEVLQKAVAEALDAVNMDTVGAEERIAKLQDEMMNAKTPEKVEEIARKIERVRAMGDRLNERLLKLKAAYEELAESEDPLYASIHDDVISAKLEAVIRNVGDTPLRDMTMSQLEDVYDMYRAVLTTIRNANKTFRQAKAASVAEMGAAAIREVRLMGGETKQRVKGAEGIASFAWNGMKPVYAFERIGSDTMRSLFDSVREGEDVWARDVSDAREFYLDTCRKYGYDGWNMEAQHSFTSSSDMEFRLNLEQIMSLYAYSKRDQAAEHLRKGGIVFDPGTEVVEKTRHGIKVKYDVTEATAYNINDVTLGEIIGTLTQEQKAFVDEMQAYLSDTMGAKGNEVSMELYGVKLFKEKQYFPLKSAGQYMAKAKEQAQGEVKIKNSGFSKETVAKAGNPIVLSGFMDVWSGHVNDMSMYHAFVLPMEDFYRVYNFKTPATDNGRIESVNSAIQNAYGKGATGYIDQLLKDLNGGARVDTTTGFINKMTGKFKKGAVFASLSVVIQQPSAIARAAAILDTKYFVGQKVDKQRHKALWEEVKKYAPIATIKEMGYFDTNMGKSTKDFITGKEYEGFSQKMKALVTDSNYRDEVLSKAPALADELAWCSIWEAVKRETREKHPGMDTRSEAFLKEAGKRFSEVIVKTQVYDSVLSRSAMMRSKDTGMKMATAFMAEPTTSINMIADALIQGKRGNIKYCRSTIGAVVASQILNSMLVSFVYAARDDDENESYMEKYLSSLTSKVFDSLNPLTYIPFIKDIVSICQGYTVERSDMAIISDLYEGFQALRSTKKTPWQKVEKFAGSVAQLFGLPLKNIMRDVRAMYQTVHNAMGGEKTTAAGVGYALKSGLPGWLGGGETSNREQLYDALIKGDAAQIQRVAGRYADQDAAESAMRSAIKDHYIAADIDAETAMDYMMRFCDMTEDEAYWKLQEWGYAAENGSSEGYAKYGDFLDAVESGGDLQTVISRYIENGVEKKTLKSQITSHFKPLYLEMEKADRANLKKNLLDAMVACGDTRKEAEERLGEWEFESEYGFESNDTKQLFISGKISESQALKVLTGHRGYESKYAQDTVDSWKFEMEHPELVGRISFSQFQRWEEEGMANGVPVELFTDVAEYRDEGEDGGVRSRDEVAAYIHSLPISDAQKDALWVCFWSRNTLRKAPWH